MKTAIKSCKTAREIITKAAIEQKMAEEVRNKITIHHLSKTTYSVDRMENDLSSMNLLHQNLHERGKGQELHYTWQKTGDEGQH